MRNIRTTAVAAAAAVSLVAGGTYAVAEDADNPATTPATGTENADNTGTEGDDTTGTEGDDTTGTEGDDTEENGPSAEEVDQVKKWLASSDQEHLAEEFDNLSDAEKAAFIQTLKDQFGELPKAEEEQPGDDTTGTEGDDNTGTEGDDNTGTEGDDNTGTEGDDNTGTEGDDTTGTEGDDNTGTEGDDTTGTEGDDTTGTEGDDTEENGPSAEEVDQVKKWLASSDQEHLAEEFDNLSDAEKAAFIQTLKDQFGELPKAEEEQPGDDTTGTEGDDTTGTEGDDTTGTEGDDTTGTEGDDTTGTEGDDTTGTEGDDTEGDERVLLQPNSSEKIGKAGSEERKADQANRFYISDAFKGADGKTNRAAVPGWAEAWLNTTIIASVGAIIGLVIAGFNFAIYNGWIQHPFGR